MRTIGLRGTGLVCVMMLACQAGCLSRFEQAIVGRQENLDTGEINKIMILPVLDGRRQIDKKVNFEKETSKVQERMIACLSKKGYECVAITDRAAIAMDGRQIPFAESSQIRKIGPEEAQWVMVSVVDSLDIPAMGLHLSSLSCYLFDKQIGELVWEVSVSGSTAWTLDFRLKDAVRPLMKEFPEKPRK